jgi:predicted transposase/invertase (TIGR01784 family)
MEQPVSSSGHITSVKQTIMRLPGRTAVFYLARMMAGQLKAGQTYQGMASAVRIDLLDFDLYPEDQAVWSFAMRDEKLHHRTLTEAAEIRLIELPKYERLGWKRSVLSDWVKFFKHPKDQAIMETIETPEVRQASSALFDMSLDEATRMRLFQEERDERDRVSELYQARQDGREEGLEQGLERGLEQGREQTARNLILQTPMDDAAIAAICNLDAQTVARLREQRGR